MTHQQATDMFRSNDLIGIGVEADKIRQKLHPEGVVTYAVQGALDLASVQDAEVMLEQGKRLAASGASSATLTDGPLKNINIKACTESLRVLKQQVGLFVSGFSPQQLAEAARSSDLSLADAVTQLQDAGLDSISNEGMHASGNNSVESQAMWCEAHRVAHKAGMKTIAKVIFRTGETAALRIDALETVARIQEETEGFVSVAPVFHEESAEEPTAVEYLKTLALTRLCLPRILNCEDSWRGAGLKVCQVGLRFGGNDLGSVEGAGTMASRDHATAARIIAGDLRRLVRDAGFLPKERDLLYTTYFLD